MPQWRKLHAKFVDSEDVNDMPDDFTRLTWAVMPIALDSEGRAQDDATWLRSKLYPKRRDVSLEMVEGAICWFAERRMIVRYQANNRHYFYVPTFKLYQGKTDREAVSVIPEPPSHPPKGGSSRRKAKTTPPVEDLSLSGPTHELVRTGANDTQPGSHEPVRTSSSLDSDSDSEEIQIQKKKDSAASPRRRDPVFDAIAEVCAADVTIDGIGRSVGMVAAALKKASPPYSADEILAWGREQAWRSSPPTVWQLKQGIGAVRKKSTAGVNGRRAEDPAAAAQLAEIVRAQKERKAHEQADANRR